jgi:hypothetical protein
LCFKPFSRKSENEEIRKDKQIKRERKGERDGRREGKEEFTRGERERFTRGEREERENRSLPLAHIIRDTDIRGMGERLVQPSASHRLSGEK